MAKEPAGVVGAGDGTITKRTGYSEEQHVPRSPAKGMVREWATPSYSASTGRGHNFDEGGDRQVPSAGRHTTIDNTKSRSRPGRW